ncbi:MAG: hypothetical protein Q4F26_03380 [Atopococcus tabaci]|uniref:Uncharacterized protein n=1 Tax=Atopococcus tabaci TaxID=269774 RepID=A0AA43ZS26_9LACT|nr:hypothetical protein [Atopococcus tabaci]
MKKMQKENKPLFISFLILLTYLLGNTLLIIAAAFHWLTGKKRKQNK